MRLLKYILGFYLCWLIAAMFLFSDNPSYAASTKPMEGKESKSRISDVPLKLQTKKVADRPKPLLELGDPFLGTGPISDGFEIPTGAVWQPSFMMWGTYRSAFQTFYDGNDYVSEWANRFDLFGNLYLTPTERILAGVRFLDEGGRFTGYTFHAPDSVRDPSRGFDDHYNFELTTLFFEGDLGEIFPNLDKKDKHSLDYYISVGRQPIRFQQGMLINDNIDALGISKINLKPATTVNMRTSVVWGVDQINRTNLSNDDDDSMLYGIFNEIDWRKSTVEIDAIYVDSNKHIGQGVYLGVGATQRLGHLNTTFRVLGSIPVAEETIHNSSGVVLFSELAFTPHGHENYVYLNTFYAIDHFRSASRGPSTGGPLGPTGILFEAVGLGRYASPLSNEADDAFGGAIGYQMFFKDKREQIVIELGGRFANDEGQRAIGPGFRYQRAFGRRGIFRIDGFAVYDRDRQPSSTNKDDELRWGIRLEVAFKF